MRTIGTACSAPRKSVLGQSNSFLRTARLIILSRLPNTLMGIRPGLTSTSVIVRLNTLHLLSVSCLSGCQTGLTALQCRGKLRCCGKLSKLCTLGLARRDPAAQLLSWQHFVRIKMSMNCGCAFDIWIGVGPMSTFREGKSCIGTSNLTASHFPFRDKGSIASYPRLQGGARSWLERTCLYIRRRSPSVSTSCPRGQRRIA